MNLVVLNGDAWWPSTYTYSQSSIHFVKSAAGVDHWEDVQYMVDIQDEVPDPLWDDANKVEPDVLQLSNQPEDGFVFAKGKKGTGVIFGMI